MNISLSPEILFTIVGFPVTNTFIWTLAISLFLILVTLFIRIRNKEVPGRFQGFIEVLLEGAYSFVKSIIGIDKKAKRVFPLVFTMFILILVANLIPYIPGQSAVTLGSGDEAVPVFRAVMSDYGFVFIMTMITVLLTQIIAIITNGPFGYLGKFINLKGIKKFFIDAFKGKIRIGQFFQGFLDFFLGIMDIVGEVAKIVSLSFRLFGNIFASEVLTAVMLFLAPFIVPLPFMFLGLLTAVVQAFVFSVLTLIFISMASEIEEDPLAESVTP